MQLCKRCYQTHEDAVEICDCGSSLVGQPDPWLQRSVRHYFSPACPQCGQPMTEELTAENNGFGRVNATMRCANCQQWHVVQRIGPPYVLLILIGIGILSFLLLSSGSILLIKLILGVVYLILALFRVFWPIHNLFTRDSHALPTSAIPEPAPQHISEKISDFKEITMIENGMVQEVSHGWDGDSAVFETMLFCIVISTGCAVKKN